MRRSLWTMLLGALLVLVLGVAGCGGEDEGSGTGEGGTDTGAPVEGKQGGKLTALWTDDVDFIDPGQTYYQMGFQIAGAVGSPLYWYKPDDSVNAEPLLAEGDPQISEDGKTVTVKIKSGVRFAPPVDREITANDVKYAIERGFFNTVNNGYAGAYFGDIEGAETGVDPGTKISGIEVPDDQTIVFKLTKPTAGTLAGALAMPLTVPVPEEWAEKFDKKNPSTYGDNQIASGPYMIENNAEGKAVGYEPGRRIHLVRNPNWDKSKDFRPAYADEWDMPQGNNDTTVASRQVLTGSGQVSGDFDPPPAILKQALTGPQKEQLVLVPAGGSRWISMDTQQKPFDDVNVRKAVVAGFDRAAARLARGGETVGKMPTHFIPPEVPGFEESNGEEGFGLDFLNTTGEPQPDLSAEYFKKAGYSSGKYEGDEEILMVGTGDGVAQKVAEIAQENFQQMGFKVRLRLVTQDSMYTKFCNVPDADVHVCPNVGWFKDFSDAQTLLDPTFNGELILDEGNSNWSELDVPEINSAMQEARTITDPAERAKAWAEINKMITEQAPAIPYVWDLNPMIRSKDVNGAASGYLGNWDLTFTSLK